MLKIAFVGDFLYPFNDRIFVKTDETIDDIDFIVGNLESPIIIENKRYHKNKKLINLYSLKAIEEFIKFYKIRVVSLANNHIFDYGVEGFKDTIDFLNEIGVKYCGAGMNIEEANAPCLIEEKGIKLAFLSYGWDLIQCVIAKQDSPGVAPINKEVIINNVLSIRNKVDIIIVLMHWGYEFEIYPLPIHRKIAKELIEAGVDIVIGSHPHVIQGFEKWRKGYIFYSLGNFFFPDVLFGNVRVNFTHQFVKRSIPPYGLVVLFKINENKEVIGFDVYKSSYKVYDSKYFVSIENFDLNFARFWNSLNSTFEINDEYYIKFFVENRTVRKGLPVFTGDKKDLIRRVVYKMREALINLVVSFFRGYKKLKERVYHEREINI